MRYDDEHLIALRADLDEVYSALKGMPESSWTLDLLLRQGEILSRVGYVSSYLARVDTRKTGWLEASKRGYKTSEFTYAQSIESYDAALKIDPGNRKSALRTRQGVVLFVQIPRGGIVA